MAKKGRLDPAAIAVVMPAIDAVRKVLLRRDPEDVPHGLRRVVQSSGPKLPPPMLRTLLDHLESDEELRIEAAALTEDVVARAFLERSRGWWALVGAAVEEVATSRMDAASADTDRELGIARAEVEEARKRLAAAKDEADRAARDLTASRSAMADRLPEHRVRGARDIAALEAELAAQVRRVSELSGELVATREDLEGLRRRSPKGKRASGEGDTSRSPGLGSDPVSVARSLDLTYRMAAARHVHPGSVDSPEDGVPDSMEPPPGLRDTDPAWFDWLPSAGVPLWLLVDGHNVVFSISDDRARTPDSMRRLEAAMRRLKKRTATPLRITVVYDSDLPGERPGPQVLGGLDIRFTPRETIADDVIVDLAAAASEHVVVVTSDRELKERIGAGATVIDGLALAAHVSGSA